MSAIRYNGKNVKTPTSFELAGRGGRRVCGGADFKSIMGPDSQRLQTWWTGCWEPCWGMVGRFVSGREGGYAGA